MSCPPVGLTIPFWLNLGVPKWPKNSQKQPKTPFFGFDLRKPDLHKNCQLFTIFLPKFTQSIYSFGPIVLNLSFFGKFAKNGVERLKTIFSHIQLGRTPESPPTVEKVPWILKWVICSYNYTSRSKTKKRKNGPVDTPPQMSGPMMGGRGNQGVSLRP